MSRCLFIAALFCSSLFHSGLHADTKVAVRSAAFFHNSERFRHLFGNVGACFEVQASKPLPICAFAGTPYELWTNFDWFSKEKKQSHSSQMRARIANASIGVNSVYSGCEKYDFYLGIGASVSRIFINKSSRYRSEKISKLAVGGVLKSGFRSYFYEPYFADLFVDYVFQSAKYHQQIDIGGLKMGLGLGIIF